MTPALTELESVRDDALCASPHHAAAIARVLESTADFVTQEVPPPSLVSLVLTGSFARGEGTVLEVDDHLRVLGDLELFIVTPDRRHDRALRARLADLSREATARYGSREVRVDIEVGSLDLDSLRHRARPSIFLFDLVQHGRIVRGRADVLAEVPPFGPEDIPREDAVALVFNRLIEQLDTYERAGHAEGETLLDLAQQRQKLLLDLAGSALAFQGSHTPSYALRPSAFARLAAATPALARRLPGGFQHDLALSARGKLDPTAVRAGGQLVGVGLREQRAWIRERIVSGVPAATAVLTWELERLLERSGPLATLLDHFVASPSPSRRAWDWAKAALAPVPAPLPVSLTRAARLAWQSTPRALLHAAGALAYHDLPRGPVAPRAIARRLFLARRAMPRDASGQRRAIVALWRWCVRNS